MTPTLQGNLLVWPRSHVLVHKCLVGVYGAINLPRLQRLLQNPQEDTREYPQGGARAGLAIEDDWSGVGHTDTEDSKYTDESIDATGEIRPKHENEPSDLPALGPPVHLTARRGDVFVLHPDLAHTGGPNYGPNIRTVVYFRLTTMPVKAGAGVGVDRVEERIEVFRDNKWALYSDRVVEIEKAAR